MIILTEFDDVFGGGIMKRIRTKICIVLLSFLLLSVASGYLISYLIERNIVVDYFQDIVIAEDIIIDDQELVDVYGDGGPIVISSGLHGRIEDSIAAIGGDTKGYEYINAYIYCANGKSLNVAISIDSEVDNDVMVVESGPHPVSSNSGLDNTNVRIVYPVIGISKIDSYQRILSEYKQSREDYYSGIRAARIKGVVTGIITSLILCCGFGLITYQKLKHHDNR